MNYLQSVHTQLPGAPCGAGNRLRLVVPGSMLGTEPQRLRVQFHPVGCGPPGLGEECSAGLV